MKKTGIIYIATDTARDNLQYVGQTIRTLERRKKEKYNPYFQNAINDHGDQIEWKIVEEVPIEKLDSMECCYIWGLDTMHPNGYNFDSGGNKNKIVSEKSKRKMSESGKGKRLGEENGFYGKHHSVETKQKLSEANTGKKHSAEAKRKIGEASKNRKVSAETKKKMSEAQKGKKHTEETKKKISKAKTGSKNPLYGKRRSKETRRKISETLKGKKLKKKTSKAKKGKNTQKK